MSFTAALLGGIAGGLAKGGVSAALSDSVGDLPFGDMMADAGIKSSLQGANPPPPGYSGPKDELVPSSFKEVIDETVDSLKTQLPSSLSEAASKSLSRALGPSASRKGRDNREYLSASFPELNPWELSGSSATGAGTQHAEQNQAGALVDKQNASAQKIAGINSITSRLNNADQVYAQNEMLAFNKAKADAEIKSILASTDKTEQEKRNLIAQVHKTEADTLATFSDMELNPFRKAQLSAGAYRDMITGSKAAAMTPAEIRNLNARTEGIQSHTSGQYDENVRSEERHDWEWRDRMRRDTSGSVDPVSLPGRPGRGKRPRRR